MAFTLGNENMVKIFIRLQKVLYSGDTDSTSTVTFCVEIEILSLELGRAIYRLLSYKEEVFQTYKYLKLFSFRLAY